MGKCSSYQTSMNTNLVVIMILVVQIILVLLLLFCDIFALSDSAKEIKLLHVIFRHGSRTPADTYPKDPYVNESFFPTGWGQLTNDGKMLMYKNGLFIRKTYNDFLGDIYSPSIVFTHTTDTDRAKMSAQLMNAAMWPPNSEQKWGPLDWQPIPIHYDKLNEDNLLLIRKPCAQYHIEFARILSNGEVHERLADNEELFKNLTEITNLKIKDFDDVQSLYSTLKAEEGFNLTLPQWTKKYYPDILEDLTIYSYVVNAYNEKLQRLKGGVLLRKLLVDWYQVANKSMELNSELVKMLESKEWVKDAAEYGDITNDRKLFLYSGHDSTISNLLSALKVWDPQIPGYGITIIFELLRDLYSGEFGVQIYLRNETNNSPHLLTIPGCESFCLLDKLTELVDPVIPRNWEEECSTDDPNYIHPELGGP